MNLSNADCFRDAAAGTKDLIGRFDWDGVNLAELYFESLEGLSNASRFTPMNDNVRAQFRAAGGFDPIELFQTRKDTPSQRAFLDFRAKLARDMQQQWLAEIESIRRARGYLDVVLTHVDDRLDTSMRDAIGGGFRATSAAPGEAQLYVPDRGSGHHVERSAATLRGDRPPLPCADAEAGPPRHRPEHRGSLPERLSHQAADRRRLFEVVHSAAGAFAQTALYFENSILSPDLSLLSAAAAVVSRAEMIGPKLMVDSPRGVALCWSGPAIVDGQPWPVRTDSLLFLPAGAHSAEAGGEVPALRVSHFNGELTSAQSVAANAIELSYRSSARAIAVLNRKPTRVEIDGAEAATDPCGPKRALPPARPAPGHHPCGGPAIAGTGQHPPSGLNFFFEDN